MRILLNLIQNSLTGLCIPDVNLEELPKLPISGWALRVSTDEPVFCTPYERRTMQAERKLLRNPL